MGDRQTATQFYNQAVMACNDKSKPTNLQTAFQLFASACTTDPTWGEALYQYGNNNYELKNYAAAIAAYQRALQCELTDEARARVYCNLGWAWHNRQDTEKSYHFTKLAGELNPKLVHYWIHLSVLQGLRDEAAKSVYSAERAVHYSKIEMQNGCLVDDGKWADYQKQYLEARVALCFAHLFAGRYATGLELFELRFDWRLHQFLQMPYPKWRGEEGKQVFVVADQGLGDTLSYSRFIPAACARSRYVHLYIQPALMRLFMERMGHISNLNLLPAGAGYPPADAWTTFVSLPYALGLTDKEIREAPDIGSTSWALPQNWRIPDRKFHIGIAWAGSPLNDINIFRSIPIPHFLSLYEVPGIQLYGLQVGERGKELHDSGSVALIRDLAPYINDVSDTLAILKHLDLVITIESALGHIAALAGKECWIPYSYMGRDYRLGLDGETKLWTPNHRVFRQGPGNEWEPVFQKIAVALQEKVNGHIK